MGEKQKGADDRCEVSESLVPRKQLPHWGDSGAGELPSQLEQIPASHCNPSPAAGLYSETLAQLHQG